MRDQPVAYKEQHHGRNVVMLFLFYFYNRFLRGILDEAECGLGMNSYII